MNSKKRILNNIFLISLMIGLLGLPSRVTKADQPSPALLTMAAPVGHEGIERVVLDLDTPPERLEFDMGSVYRTTRAEIQPWDSLEPKYEIFGDEDPIKEPVSQPRTRVTHTVISSADNGVGTLREKMTLAGPGDTINFNASVFPPGAPTTITLASQLPYITINDLTIDASNAGVILDGSGLDLAGNPIGFVLDATQGVTIKGLQINNFFLGVLIKSGATNNTIGGNRNLGSGPIGQGNLISGNAYTGIQLQNPGTSNNEILGNLIGTSISGDSANGNANGIVLAAGATNNVIGGSLSSGVCDGYCNLISGNEYGVVIPTGDCIGNQILGNFIGTNLSGNSSLGNQARGIYFAGGAHDNVIGGAKSSADCSGPCNLISGNETGIWIQDDGTDNNQIMGNFIGSDITGLSSLGAMGIKMGYGASYNTIGGAGTGEGNLISGNSIAGIYISADGPVTTGNKILGNYIGTDLTGTSSVPNNDGILVWGGTTNTQIGGQTAGAGNLISGNINNGVAIFDPGTDGNQVIGNKIGTDLSGTVDLPNYDGVTIGYGAADTMVGGTTAGARNLISGNGRAGLWIDGETTTGTQAMGNYIGTNISGTSALANYEGIVISTGSTGNQIGGTASGTGNLVSGNTLDGIFMQSLTSPGNVILGNRIGTNASGTAVIPNYFGIFLDDALYNTIGGTQSTAGNLISGNIDSGLYLSGSDQNQVKGNKIGSDLSGAMALPNGGYGIYVLGSSNNTIGGAESGAGNLISGNGVVGILIGPETSLNNQLLGNKIGTNLSGSSSLPNQIGIGIVKAVETYIGGADTSTPWVCDGPCNLISGNSVHGILIQGASGGETSSPGGEERELTGQLNQVLGNFIGTDLAGTSAVPNEAYGISLDFEANGNLVGGSNLLGEGNLISGNDRGIVIRGVLTDGNQVAGNRIGTTSNGNTALGNGDMGVTISESASNNIIGGDEPGMGNLISGHHTTYDEQDLISHFGLVIESIVEPQALNNQVIGNLIGTNAAGTTAIPNSTGIWLNQLVSNTDVRDNVLSGNALRGIFINEASGNEIMDNLIGLASDGTFPLSNQMGGVVVFDSQDNILGPGNSIAYHQFGITVVKSTSLGNTITQNSIYSNTEKQIVFFDEAGDPLIPLPVQAPVLSGFDSGTVTGTACPGCVVEVFANLNSQPAGRQYLGTATADGGGGFSLVVGTGHIFLAATATDTAGTTSEFSESLQVGTLEYVYLPLILK